MKSASFEDSTCYATKNVNPALFYALTGTTPTAFCEEKAPLLKTNEELRWRIIHSVPESFAQYNVSKASDDDEQCAVTRQLSPWLHRDDYPAGIEPSALCLRLLDEGGDSVIVLHEMLPYSGALVEYGMFFRDPVVQLTHRWRRRPISDVCQLWVEEMRCFNVLPNIVLGFALNCNQLWVPHAWLVERDGTFIDSGRVPFQHYFGVIVSTDNTQDFVQHFYPQVGDPSIGWNRWADTTQQPIWR